MLLPEQGYVTTHSCIVWTIMPNTIDCSAIQSDHG